MELKTQKTQEPPLLIGLRAARANLVPGLVLQGAMLAIVLAYFYHEPTERHLNVLAHYKEAWGYGFSALLSVFAGGILPEIFKILFIQKGSVSKRNFTNLLFTIPFWAFMGVCVDCLYRLQSVWFGSDPTVLTLVKKVAVDQFLYSALFSAPVSLIAYDWHQRGIWEPSRIFSASFWSHKLLPTVIANWGVWIPLVAIIYSLPPLLQVPISSLALTFWVLIFTFITEH